LGAEPALSTTCSSSVATRNSYSGVAIAAVATAGTDVRDAGVFKRE
jgi:hypothetical protein